MKNQMEKIIEQLGEAVYTEEDVHNEFHHRRVTEIKDILDETYVTDDNTELARMIYDEIN